MCLPLSRRLLPPYEVIPGMAIAEFPRRNGGASAPDASLAADSGGLTLRAETAHHWISTVIDLLAAEDLSGATRSRVFVGSAVAMYESIVPGMTGRTSLAEQVPGLRAVPSFASRPAVDWDCALSAAVHTVLAESLPLQSADAATLLDGRYAWQVFMRRACGVDERLLSVSQQWGRVVGYALVDWTTRSDTYGPPAVIDLDAAAARTDVTTVLTAAAGSIAAATPRLVDALEAYARYGLALDDALRRGIALPQVA